MPIHATVVFYPKNKSIPEVFYVMNINHNKLQKAFGSHDIVGIKCITVEIETLVVKYTRTLFTESDINEFLNIYEIDYKKYVDL